MTPLINWCTFFVLNSVWQFPVLFAIAALLVRFLPKLSNALEYRIWVGCLLLGVAVPSLSTYLAVVPVHRVRGTDRVSETDRWKAPHPPQHGHLTEVMTAVEVTPAVRSPFGLMAGTYLVSVLVGISFLTLRLEKTRRIVDGRVALMPQPQAIAEGPRRHVGVFVGKELRSPATLDWPVPMILVPEAFEDMPGLEQDAVIAHELAHIVRSDFVKNLLLEIASLPLSYHPMTRYLRRKITESREVLCDDLAAESTSQRGTYAQALLNVARRLEAQSPSLSLVLEMTTTQLERRIMKLLQEPLSVSPRLRYFTQALCLLALLGGSVGVLRLSLHPVSVQAAGSPAFPFDPSQTFDTLKPIAERQLAPNFTLVDNSGKKITLSDYKGKVVLLDFWATWCGGCKLEIPWYIKFDRKYRKEGLAVIGVSMDEKGWDAVRPFLAKKRDDETGGMIAMQYPIVIGNDALASRFGLTSMPMTLLIDKSGRIAVSHTGVVDKGNFESNILQLLKQ